MFDPYSVWTPDGVVTGRVNVEQYKVRKIKDRLGQLMLTCQMNYIYCTIFEVANMEEKAMKLFFLDEAVEAYCKQAVGFDNLDLVEAVNQMKQEIKSGSGPSELFR